MDAREVNKGKNYYNNHDRDMFDELLPTLLSSVAKKTKWAKKEHKQLMDRFEKSFGGSPSNNKHRKNK